MLSQQFYSYLSRCCTQLVLIRNLYLMALKLSMFCTMIHQWKFILQSLTCLHAALAGCVLVFFPTILLILYPQNCSEGVSHVVDFAGGTLCTFVESFHGQYKDGTNGTHDFRMVSASFLILRIVILVLFLNCHRLSSHTSQHQHIKPVGATVKAEAIIKWWRTETVVYIASQIDMVW